MEDIGSEDKKVHLQKPNKIKRTKLVTNRNNNTKS